MSSDVLPARLLTGAELRKLFDDKKILGRNMKRPSADALESLATLLDVLRWVFSSKTPDDDARYLDVNRTMQRFQAAFGELAETTPVLIRWFLPFANPQMTGATAEVARARIALLLEFERVIPQMQKLFSERDFPSQLDWHDLALLLAEGFRKAMRLSNPRARLRPSRNGPVGRFLVFAIQYVTGETPNDFTIEMYLRRKSPKGNKPG